MVWNHLKAQQETNELNLADHHPEKLRDYLTKCAGQRCALEQVALDRLARIDAERKAVDEAGYDAKKLRDYLSSCVAPGCIFEQEVRDRLARVDAERKTVDAAEQRASERERAEQKSPATSAPARRPVLETGYNQLWDLGKETEGYGLYSYVVLTAASDRSVAFLREIFKSIPFIGETAAARFQLNILYIPTRRAAWVHLLEPVQPALDEETTLAVRYSWGLYDYKMARAILDHICNPPAETMKDLCRGSMSRGPYILTYAKPASGLEPVPPPFLFVDLSDVNPNAYPEFIGAFRAVVKQDDVTDDAKLHSLRLKVLNIALTAADWVPLVERSVVDIVHGVPSVPNR